MKFRKLEIHNIASIENAVIDFEAEPLASSEVFLITGKTGAGKSTILDAICLALYNNTPRLADSHSTTSDLKDVLNEGDRLHINSTRQLLRRNEGVAWATLTFKGSDGIEYEAKWYVQRSHKNPSKKVQDVKRTITNLLTGESTSTIKDINELVYNKAVGLTFDQFCRTTMLAQGEFTKFLKSNEENKSKILEHITGTSIYPRIGQKIYELYKGKKDAYTRLCDKAEGKKGLTDEELTEKKAEIKRIDDDLKLLDNQKKSLSDKKTWLKDDADLLVNQQKAQQHLDNAQVQVDSDEVKQASMLVSQWNATIEVRGWLRQQHEAQQNVKRTSDLLQNLSRKYAQLQGGYAAQQKAVEDMKIRASQVSEALQMQSDKADVFAQHQAIETLLQHIIDAQDHISTAQNNEKALSQQLDDVLTPALNSAIEKHQQQHEKVQALLTDVSQKEEHLEKINLQALNDQKNKLMDREHHLQTASERLSEVENSRNRLENEAISIGQLKDAIIALQKQEADLTQKVHDADLTQKERQRTFELIEAQTQNWAKTLRAKLTAGDVCPVCFQKVTSPIYEDRPENDIYGQAKKEADEAKRTYDDLSKLLYKTISDCKAQQDSYTRRKEAFDKDHSLKDAEQRAKEALSIVDIDAEDAAEALTGLRTKNEQQLTELQKQIEEGNALQSSLNKARRELEKQQKVLDQLKKQLDTADKDVQDCQSKIATAQQLSESYRKDCQEKEQQVDASLSAVSSWASQWRKDPKQFKTTLHVDAQAYDKLQKEKAQIEHHIETEGALLNRVAVKLVDIQTMCPGWTNLQPASIHLIPQLENEVDTLIQKATQEMANLRLWQASLQTHQTQVEKFLAAHADLTMCQLHDLVSYTQETIDRMKEMVMKPQDNLKSQQTLLEKAKQEYAAHQQIRPDMQAGETAETLTSQISELATKQSELQQLRGSILQQLADDQTLKQERATLLQAMAEALKEQNRWERLNRYFGDADGKDFRTIAQSYVLAQLIHSANAYMTQLTDRYRLYIPPGSFAVYIEDAYQGYVRRPASTISGGESFLVSLALALALSDIDQQQSADILFIDEGFGTLSGDPLDKAVNTLRTLHSTSRRRVGIISHIDELRERIPVQIHVDRVGHDSKSVVSVAEV